MLTLLGSLLFSITFAEIVLKVIPEAMDIWLVDDLLIAVRVFAI